MEINKGHTGFNVWHKVGKQAGDTDSTKNACNRCEYEHETHHHASKVDAGGSVEDDEDVCVGQVLEAVIQAKREKEDKELKVKVER